MPPVTSGPDKPLWRSLDELAQTPEFLAHVGTEFPAVNQAIEARSSRRDILKLMGASLALAGAAGCRWPRENILPYSKRPTGRIPGTPVYYATNLELGGVARGVLISSQDGRPIKVEGNELHPGSLGGTDALAQAAILDLYDPDRALLPTERVGATREARNYAAFMAFAQAHFTKCRAAGGKGLAVLTECTASPTLARVKGEFLAAYPQAQWFEYEPVARDNERAGTRLAFGAARRPIWRLDKADVVVSLDCDFLLTHPNSVRYTRDFASRRTADDGTMLRLYSVEATLSLTGSNADHRFAVRPSELGRTLGLLAGELVRQGMKLPDALRAALPGQEAGTPAYVRAIAEDLLAAQGRGLIVVGPRQTPEAHALAAALNEALGATGNTVTYVEEPDAGGASCLASIRQLTTQIAAGSVSTLLILDGNPAYTAPADLEFAQALEAVATRIHLSARVDETSAHCHWHVPIAHWLESWGDARAWDGTYGVVQPLIEPLYGGWTPIEMLAFVCGPMDAPARGYDLVRETFKGAFAPGADFEDRWRSALHDGLVAGTAFTESQSATNAAAVGEAVKALVSAPPATAGTFDVIFAQDHKVYDGRFANNGWLQELPDPLTKLTWDNAALMSPVDVRKLGIGAHGRVSVTVGQRSLSLPVHAVPGHAVGAVTLPLGYGRKRGGYVANVAGVDTYALRTSAAMDHALGATLRPTGGAYKLATTQDHHSIRSEVGDRETQARIGLLVLEQTLEDYKAHPDEIRHRVHLPVWQPFEGHRFPNNPNWATAVDLARCTGCSACVIACQAENNIPVVGKNEVLVGREMHWLRIDRYFRGDPENADQIEVLHQPIFCQQCENAPCEQVCPVAATMHDAEGLNVMVYNRCIGTRYCLNNCPWKVRRFNWFWNHHGPAHPRSMALGQPFYFVTPPHEGLTPIEKMAMNPQVTVRSRGVMEKCAYCIHRIQRVKIVAKNEGRPIRDGEITPACAQACPAEAIVFGDLMDPSSRVSKAHEQGRAYAMLGELNARARNRFLARLRNPSSTISGERLEPAGHGQHRAVQGGGSATHGA